MAYQSRIDGFGWTVEQCAEKAGVSPARVNAKLKLLGLRDEIRQLVRTGSLQQGWGQMIASVPLDPNRQMTAVRMLQENPNPQVSWLKRVVTALYAEQAQEALFETELLRSPQVEELAAPNMVEPPRPGNGDPPGGGGDVVVVISNQIAYWENAASAWDLQGRGFARNECLAASAALRSLLASLEAR